jgi:hypothetical protein
MEEQEELEASAAPVVLEQLHPTRVQLQVTADKVVTAAMAVKVATPVLRWEPA